MTHFSYPERFSRKNRSVKLDGEAYFEVARNEKLPFDVETEQMAVRVKGTKFNIYAYKSQPITETTLVDGKVSLSFNNNGSSGFELSPGQKAIYERGSFAPKIIDKVDTEIETSWTKGIYNFNNITFDKLVSRLEHYYDMRIVVNRKDILNYQCTGKFLYDETIQDILDVVKTSKPFKYKIENRLITIY
jgi:ferric-dicitrate binding protein FerR (iron transport regulator)